VKDIRLVTLVGTKTAGIASDPSTKNLLDDGSPLALRADGQLSADHELINGIGASRPGYYLPLTTHDLRPEKTLTSPRRSPCPVG
jgi:carboxyl-terminal processing protease